MHANGSLKRHTKSAVLFVKLVLYSYEYSHIAMVENQRGICTSSEERPVRSGERPNAGGPSIVARAEAAECCALSCEASIASSTLLSVLAFQQAQKPYSVNGNLVEAQAAYTQCEKCREWHMASS